jgi:hypothetical protein
MPLLAGHFLQPPRFGKKEMFMVKDQREIQRKLRILRQPRRPVTSTRHAGILVSVVQASTGGGKLLLNAARRA